ncbi:CHASE domain-containing protein [Massilia sp. NR 4-1]|uniref:CHASE domain-containing protein n=1 Tax=Massilia sp. NR 4-1 TaxID=1678028 RepID=UPI00067E4B98|nr:CHASE domain-containing protein [Massilia sp. NR 4-1]AKU22187.1 histidine kinase [Massilia sp. NR 4-1]
MRIFQKQRHPSTLSNPKAWGGVLLSLGVGALLYFVAYTSTESEARERFAIQAGNTQYNIVAGIKAYTDVLRSAASFFQAVDEVTPENFRRYVSGLDLAEHFPAIASINFARHLKADQRPAFEQSMRHWGQGEGYPGFRLQPPGLRTEYAVLTLLEPMTDNHTKYGMDIAIRPQVALALAQSRDSGELSSSGQPVGLTEPGQSGMGLRLPVYRKGLPAFSVAERRAAYMGSVGIGFSIQRLMQGALADTSLQQMRVTLYNGIAKPGAPAPLLLFDSESGMAHGPKEPSFELDLPVNFNGHLWNAHFSMPERALYSRFDVYLPWLAGALSGTACLLLYALFHTLSSSRQRAIKMARAMTRELRDSQAKLQLSHQKLRRLAAHSDKIKEEERKRIAREIHDDLGQNLLVLRIEADMLASRTQGHHPRLHARASATLRQIDNTIGSVRHIINDLRPHVLDLGLSAAVEWQIGQFRQRSGISCELVEDGSDKDIDDHCATAYFRILQESLSNISQHAKASQVRVELRHQGGTLRMTISDNGVGIRASSRNKSGSFGLVGIEERVNLLGGQCSIIGIPDAGTTVTVMVPLHTSLPTAPSAAATLPA